jgi:hypothetical protein
MITHGPDWPDETADIVPQPEPGPLISQSDFSDKAQLSKPQRVCYSFFN